MSFYPQRILTFKAVFFISVAISKHDNLNAITLKSCRFAGASGLVKEEYLRIPV